VSGKMIEHHGLEELARPAVGERIELAVDPRQWCHL